MLKKTWSLKAIRVDAGFSQKEMGEKLNVGTSTICRWEAGQVKNIPKDKFIEFCKICNMDSKKVRVN